MKRYNKKIIALVSTLILMSTMSCTSVLAYTKNDKIPNIKLQKLKREKAIKYDEKLSFVSEIDKSSLIKKIDEGAKVIDDFRVTGYLTDRQSNAINALKQEVFKARNLLNSGNVSQEQIGTQIKNIDKAINEFYESKRIPKEIDLSILSLISSSSAEYGYLNAGDDLYNIVNNYTGSDFDKIDRTVYVTVIADKDITVKFGDEAAETGNNITRTVDICNKDKYPLVISGDKGCRYRIIFKSTGEQFPNPLGYYTYNLSDVLKIGETNVRRINYSGDPDTLSFKVDEPGIYSIEILPKDVCYENRFNALTIREIHTDTQTSNNLYCQFNTVGFDATGYELKSIKNNVFYQIDVMGCNPTDYSVIIKKE